MMVLFFTYFALMSMAAAVLTVALRNPVHCGLALLALDSHGLVFLTLVALVAMALAMRAEDLGQALPRAGATLVGVVYILEGTITDHRDGIATDYGPGVGWPEDRNTTHWLENRGTSRAVEISVDIVRDG